MIYEVKEIIILDATRTWQEEGDVSVCVIHYEGIDP